MEAGAAEAEDEDERLSTETAVQEEQDVEP
jgi:hypothetical protein